MNDIKKNFSVLIVFASLTALNAFAGISGTSGDVHILATPPATVMPNAFENDHKIWIFNEQMNYLLGGSVNVNITAPGYYNSNGSLTHGTIASGQRVNVYYMHFDPKRSKRRSGTVTFDEAILGVIVTKGDLTASNFLGSGGTIYPSNVNNMGLEMGSDRVRVSPDMKTLTVDWQASSPGDRIRVMTVVPEPASMIALGTGLVSLFGLRRRSKK